MTEPFVDVEADVLFPKSRTPFVQKEIRKFNEGLDPRWRREKFKVMVQDPFAFFRGTDHLFWADFGPSRLLRHFGGKKSTRTWISGDLHCDNLGTFTDAMGWLVYDLNDFDEGVVADFQYDLWRLAVSLVLVGRRLKKKEEDLRGFLEILVKSYIGELKRCSWYDTACYTRLDEDEASGELRHFLNHIHKHHGRKAMLERWTEEKEGHLKFQKKTNSDLAPLPKELAPKLAKALRQYVKNLKPWPVNGSRSFEILDLACRLRQGVGSYGFNRYYVLLLLEEEGKEQHRILDVKFQPKPSSWSYLPKKFRQKTKEECGGNHALRTVLAQKALGRHTDPWLGWLDLADGTYAVRERSPYKASLPNERIDGETIRQMGGVLARAHSRARKKFPVKVLARIKGRKEEFRDVVLTVAQAYADQVEMDYQSFRGFSAQK